MSKNKRISLAQPKAKKGKALALVLLGIGLYLVITDPVGSAETVKHVADSLQAFSALMSGGGQP